MSIAKEREDNFLKDVNIATESSKWKTLVIDEFIPREGSKDFRTTAVGNDMELWKNIKYEIIIEEDS